MMKPLLASVDIALAWQHRCHGGPMVIATGDRKSFTTWAKGHNGGQITTRGDRLEQNVLRQRFRWRSQHGATAFIGKGPAGTFIWASKQLRADLCNEHKLVNALRFLQLINAVD